MTDHAPMRISRRGVLRAGAVGIGAALLGTAACSDDDTSGGGGSSALDYYYAPCPMGEHPYSLELMQSTFGVTFKTKYQVTQPDYSTKFQALLAQGQVPDASAMNGPDMLQTFAAQDVFGEVSTDLIREHAPNYAAGVDKHVPVAWATSLYNGKNYGFPGIGGPSAAFSAFTEWRSDLLEKAGVGKVPETLDEFEQAFAALKRIGVYGMTSGGQSYFAAFMTIFGAHGVLPMQWQILDGKLVNGAVHPMTRQALELLASWYQKGYIDPECMGANPALKFIAGKAAMFDYGGPQDIDPKNQNGRLFAIRQSDANGKLEFGLPPEGPGGRASWSFGTSGWPVAFGRQLTKDTGKVKDVLKIWDAIWNDKDLCVKLTIGEEGKAYKLTDPAKGIDGGFQWIDKYVDPVARMAEGFSTNGTPFIGTPNWDISLQLKVPVPAERDLVQTYGKYGHADLFQNPMAVPESGKYITDLQSLKVKMFAQIITGAAPVSSFDDFVKQWNTRGGAELERQANELYAKVPH